MITDYVNYGDYTFYQFSLVKDDSIRNVTFKLNSLHGDADIYISRERKKPNRQDYEKSSAKSNELVDIIYFDGNGIATTYYIGVYSMQYSTYNLLVTIDRGQSNGGDSDSDRNYPMLSEGVGIRGSIHNEYGLENYRFTVKFLEGFEKKITI